MAATATFERNRLLALLSPAEFERLRRHLAVVEFEHHHVFQSAGDESETAYFPLTSVVSLIVTDPDGRGVEIASVGREGVVGLPAVLAGAPAFSEVVQQVSGALAQIPMATLRAEIARNGELGLLMDRYAVGLLNQIGRQVICLRLHAIESRAARWLLACQDRVGRDDFTLTQDFFALMLGNTRPQVSLAASALRRAGLIDYRRGHITIRDREGLEAVSCDCYGMIRDGFSRVLGDGADPIGG